MKLKLHAAESGVSAGRQDVRCSAKLKLHLLKQVVSIQFKKRGRCSSKLKLHLLKQVVSAQFKRAVPAYL